MSINLKMIVIDKHELYNKFNRKINWNLMEVKNEN